MRTIAKASAGAFDYEWYFDPRCPPLNWSLTMAPPESGTIAVLAEKPSVARDIAHVLGATSKGDGYLHGNGYVVAWAIGQSQRRGF